MIFSNGGGLSTRLAALLGRQNDRGLSLYNSRLARAKETWRNGVNHEVSFWQNWISKRYNNADAWNALLAPDRPLQDEFIELIELNQPGDVVRILDVGSGPLTGIGKVWKGHRVVVTPIDPLADQYNAALDGMGVERPIKTIQCAGEDIAEHFPEGTFDLAYAANCLDHSYDPIRIFRHMVMALRPGSYALLAHAQNEAVHEKNVGLHQWNFDIQDGQFVVWQPGVRVWVQEYLRDIAEVSIRTRDYTSSQKYLIVHMRRLLAGERIEPSRRHIADRP